MPDSTLKKIEKNTVGWTGNCVKLGKGKKVKSITMTVPKGSSEARCFGLAILPYKGISSTSYDINNAIFAEELSISDMNAKNYSYTTKSGTKRVFINPNTFTEDNVDVTFNFDVEKQSSINCENIVVIIYNATNSMGCNNSTFANYETSNLYLNINNSIMNNNEIIFVQSSRIQYNWPSLSEYYVARFNIVIKEMIAFTNMVKYDPLLNDDDKTNVSGYIDNIQCSNIEYRTLSEPAPDLAGNQTGKNIHNGWHDGGETLFSCYNDSNSSDGVSLIVPNASNQIKINNTLVLSDGTGMNSIFNYNSPSLNYNTENHVNYIVNLQGVNDKNQTSFIEEYDIPQGRLYDVVFASPEQSCSELNPRYVFKRSRIKFTFNVPEKTRKGNKSFILRYKVNTGVRYQSDCSTINKIQNRGWISCKYDVSKYKGKSKFSLIICPRDEGVLDNSYFDITFEWAWHVSGKYTGDWKTGKSITYYFKTYQKPQINITYPKIIRNKYTGDGHRRFKLLTYNNFSNFVDENALASKYVCDSLNVMYSTQPSDGSIFSTFVRFYLAEFRFGRKNISDTNNKYDITLQQSISSDNRSDFATKNQILESVNSNMKTAYISATQNCDGSPILFSGRITTNSLIDYVSKNKIWIFNKWDEVNIENSPTTFNSFKTSKNEDGTVYTTKELIKDHYHYLKRSNDNTLDVTGSTINQEVTDLILFRAGYIYLLKLRSFHGAACGQISNRPYTNNEYNIQYGYNYNYKSNENSGFYNYSKMPDYGYDSVDKVNCCPDINDYNSNSYDEIDKYKGSTRFWNGPPDGTSGYDVEHEFINRTYPGFSESDYTLIQPVCPFTSKSNIILKHPSSHETGANQWLTFSYRHLSKNLGGIEYDKEKVLNRTRSGIDNTLTRICGMHYTCTSTIASRISKEFNDFNPEMVSTDAVNLFASAINQLGETYSYNGNNDHGKTLYNGDTFKLNGYNVEIYLNPNLLENHIPYYGVTNNAGYPSICFNKPLRIIGNNSKKISHLQNMYGSFFTGSSNLDIGTFKNEIGINNNSITATYPEAYISRYNSEHFNVNGKSNKVVTFDGVQYYAQDDPSGNVYRWQVVINAIDNNNKLINIPKSNIKPKLQDINNLISSNVDTNNTAAEWNGYLSTRANTQFNGNPLSYYNDIQTKYYYEDTNNINKSQSCNCASSDIDNNSKFRFNIAEFAGLVTEGFEQQSPSYPANYVTNSGNQYFVNENNYGSLYKRVPEEQDCECGEKSSEYNLLFVESNNIESNLKEGNLNVYPLTRVSHFLYFKTRIRTSYIVFVSFNYTKTTYKGECTKEILDDDGNIIEHVTKQTNQSESKSVLAKLEWNSTRTNKVTMIPIDNQNGDLLMPISEYNIINSLDDYTQVLTDNNTLQSQPYVNFGNKGFSEVYGEDNNNWGRCLTADDSSVTNLYTSANKSNTTLSEGCIETPILVRYTPLLQPRLENITLGNNQTKSINDRIINAVIYSDTKEVEFLAHTSNSVEKVKTNQLNLDIYYPVIREDGRYNTRLANGGLDKKGGLQMVFDNYYIDTDSSEAPLDLPKDKKNTDFLGGYGICTAYDVFLVPSNPDTSSEKKEYNTNTNGHWNYFKQPANYYGTNSIENITAKSKSTYNKAKTIVVARNYSGNINNLDYLSTPDDYKRAKITIPLNINKILNRKYLNESGYKNGAPNAVRSGVTYDLVIVPIYSNTKCKTYNYTTSSGNLNDVEYNKSKQTDIQYRGSNPLVLYNFLTITSSISNNGGSTDAENPSDPLPIIDETKVLETDPAIIFPNVNLSKYNTSNGKYKELPGFWMNNSFKLILRLPSYRLKEAYNGDLLTIDQQSNNELSSSQNTIDDFRFEDIQIHIGKYSEIENNIDLINESGDNQKILAAYQIISYRHFWDKDVFSKKLKDNTGIEDQRDFATAGGLDNSDINYSHRFLEVNLSNAYFLMNDDSEKCISANDPEGMYIQFRVKTAYTNGVESQGWTPWYGGIKDGDCTWWGTKGRDYYVPLRNYSDVLANYRSLIKESAPGSYASKSNNVNNGESSLSTQPYIDESSKTNPKSSINIYNQHYYYHGNGNNKQSIIIPSCNLDHGYDINYKLGYQQYHDSKYELENQYEENHVINDIEKHTEMHEMLYLYYIVNNLSKLYYKPENEIYPDKACSNVKHNLQVPKVNNTNYVLEFNNGIEPEKFYIDRYYRRIIDKCDFDYLNKRLIDLSEYIRNIVYHGSYQEMYELNGQDYITNLSTISLSKEQLYFNKMFRQLIGHDLDKNFGQGNYNNTTFTKMESNYILELWNKILQFITPYRIFENELITKYIDDEY